jgi:putative drug exporter of the RND superfamily
MAILAGLAGVALTINVAQPNGEALASTGSYAAGRLMLQADGFPSGTLTPIPLWVPSDRAGVAHLPAT